jgi:topoisomerase IV subunit A
MDAREYKDGAGQIKVRAKIKVKDESTVVIKEIPPTTTTDSLIGSIEDASRKGKIKVKSINDFTSEEVEIEVRAPAGVSADQLVDALYAFTSCEVTIASRIVVIRNNRPVEMTVSEVLRENTISLPRSSSRNCSSKKPSSRGTALPHARTHLHRGAHLQKIEQCKTNEAVIEPPSTKASSRSEKDAARLSDADVEKLLQVRIRRISLFDINKHREEMDRIKGGPGRDPETPEEPDQSTSSPPGSAAGEVWPDLSAAYEVQPL